MELEYKEISCKSACNKTKRKMPYKWDLNIYRGCEHQCKYCYAVYSHKYLEYNYNESSVGSNTFFNKIYVKTNIAKELEKQISKPGWKNEMISLGTVTDSYQPVERKYELMPKILDVLIKYKNPIIISTKSDLILRDLDLINELSEINFVNVAVTITSLDDKIQKSLEQNVISSKKRINILKKIKKETNASCGLHFLPIIPYLTDSYEHIDEIFKIAEKINVDCIIPGPLNLHGKTRRIFFNFIKEDFIELYDDIFSVYRRGKLDKEYSKELFTKIIEIKKKYDVENNYVKVIKEKLKNYSIEDDSKQLTLLDF